MSAFQAPQHSTDRPESDLRNLYHEDHHALNAQSHTAQKLRHATAEHLHVTSRRHFIGPIPKGWLQSHRKSWYKARLRFKNYSSRAVSFAPDPVVQHYRENTPDETELSGEQNEDPAGAEGEQAENEQAGGEEMEDEQTMEYPNKSTESVGRRQPLQSMSRPLGETEELPPPSDSNTGDQLQSKQSHGDLSARTGEGASSSYYSAEPNPDDASTTQSDTGDGDLSPRQQPGNDSRPTLDIPSIRNVSQPNSAASASESESTRALLKSAAQHKPPKKGSTKSVPTLQQQEPDIEEVPNGENDVNGYGRSEHGFFSPFSRRVAKYNIGDNFVDKQKRLRARVARTQDGVYAMRPLRRRFREGEIIKAERMLVMVQETAQKDLPDDYAENDSLKVETRQVDKWREFLVVCRRVADEEAPFSIQMYKTRVIPESQSSGTRIKPYHEIHLDSRLTGESLYSPLDKTLVFWRPCKFGTQIYIARPKSAAHAVEWHTFILQILGGHRPTALPINVPDLGVSLIFKNPFEQLLNLGSKDERLKANNAFSRAIAEEEYASTAIIRGCLEMLEGRPEWTEVLKEWSKTTRLGLAWKRYDRLEWVFGPNEKSMYGTIAMIASHDLELRPRQHYPTAVKLDAEKEEEPLPVEGFLVRLTSQRGVHQRMNKMFFKRLYFFTQDQYLFFCKPSKAIPPAPPKMSLDDSRVPSSREILNNMPLAYDIDPFPVDDGKITWLDSGNKAFVTRRDEAAFAQYQRNIYNLCQTDGYIDLCRVKEVRLVERGSSPADHNIRQGSDVEFHPESRNTRQDDGTTKQFDDDKTFEMLMDNGLVVRLQTYNNVTRDEWMKQLDALVKYWKVRSTTDTAELKALRNRNLELLDIDEEMESIVGQLAQKWQVRKTEASPHLHNMCGLVGCRTIKLSGHLYRKPRRHAPFKKSNVVLTAGKLLIFRSILRQRNGVEVAHIHQGLEKTIDLQDCYIYSGSLTDDDLLYANQTFDSNNPGLHALPRIYLSSDVYTSCDEDTAISFVIWQPLQKDYFRARELGKRGRTKQRLRQVSKLGVHGRTMVFKARSRVERDRWVQSIASEIDRLQEEKQEDIRIVTP